MAKILIADDDGNGRELLTQVLSYLGHQVLEARDGTEALEEARAHHPDLIITDIMMPTMDGYEFVHRLRENPAIAATPVVFYSAAYRESEAWALARVCGVALVLTKPIEPEAIVHAVSTVLGSPPTTPELPANCTAGEDLGLLTDALRKTVVERTDLSARLAGLIRVGMELASQHEPGQLLAKFCRAARDLGAARYAAIGMVGEGEQYFRYYLVDGLEVPEAGGIAVPLVTGGHLATLLHRETARPVRGRRAEAEWLGLSKGFPPVDSYLGVPVVMDDRVYGWLCLLNKVGADQFDKEDERLAVTLAAQVAVAYDNARLYENIQTQSAELRLEVADRKRAEAALLRITQDLEASNHDLEEFARAAAHTLREPIRKVLIFADRLFTRAAPFLDEGARDYFGRLRKAASRMEQLAAELVEFTKIRETRPVFKRVDLGGVVREAISELEDSVAAGGSDVDLGKLPAVAGDAGQLRKSVRILMDYALKLPTVGEKPRLRVSGREAGGEVELAIGCGGSTLEEKDLERMFRPFQRFAWECDPEKAGLALAICRRIIQRHGGRIAVKSEQGKGSTYVLQLPTTQATSGAAPMEVHSHAENPGSR